MSPIRRLRHGALRHRLGLALLVPLGCSPPHIPHPPTEKTPEPIACGALTRCDGTCVDLQKDPANCGLCGRTCVILNASAGCERGECVVASCHDGLYDSDKKGSNGCEATSVCVAGSDCKTSCDSIGKTTCSDGMSSCKVPAESCNARDDDCNGSCDEGALLGCRKASIARSARVTSTPPTRRQRARRRL